MNFETAIQELSDAEVEFIIIGGWSAILHGSAHVTNDLDVFFPENPTMSGAWLKYWHPIIHS